LSGGQLLTNLPTGGKAPRSLTQSPVADAASAVPQLQAPSGMTTSVLADSRVQAADIDDELLNEINVHEADQPRD